MIYRLFYKKAIFAVAAITAAVFYGEIRYENGFDRATVQCQSGMKSLQDAINKVNEDALRKAKEQQAAYNKALIERNKQLSNAKTRLNQTVSQIRRMKHESSDKCVNTRIPDDFK